MPAIADLIGKGEQARHHRPFPRASVETDVWVGACEQLARGELGLLRLWGERDRVHMALLDGAGGESGVISLDCPESSYPSVGQHHPPALRLERALRDLFRLEPQGLPDPRPWPHHARWGARRALA